MKVDGNSSFQEPPAGSHCARCIRVIDMGTQPGGEYMGQKKPDRRKVAISWELPEELMTEGDNTGKPFTITQWYTASLTEKALLRLHLESWRGRAFTKDELKGFDLKNLIGQPCLLILGVGEHSERVQVRGIGKLGKGMACPPQVNKSVHLSLDPEEFDKSVFDTLGERTQSKIRETREWKRLMDPGHDDGHAVSTTEPAAATTDDDDVPF